MSVIQNNLLLTGGDEGYNLTRSLRFRSSASAYLNRTPASASNRKTWTFSVWIKRGSLGINHTFISSGDGNNANGYFTFRLNTDNTASIYNDPNNAGTTCDWSFTNVFRDVAAWYHFVLTLDTTISNQADRIRLYVNGVENINRSVVTYPSQNSDLNINRAVAHAIGRFNFSSNQYQDGYMAEVNFIDGQALTPSSFGETDLITGVWKAKRYAGSYGTNGFYLPFTDNSALTTSSNAGLGKDFSGNGNYWTTNNISITAGVTYDSMTDVPTLTSATASNFCTLSPITSRYTGSLYILDANLRWYFPTAGTWVSSGSTMAVSSGKYYWECTPTGMGGSNVVMVGLASTSVMSNYIVTNVFPGQYSTDYGYYTDGQKFNNNVNSAYGAGYTNNDVIGVALNMDAGTLTFYKNNVSQGTAFSGLVGTFGPAVGSSGASINVNFGQRPFTYTPPTGFVALNTYNLPTSTIVKGNTVMDATLYTGAGNTSSSITNAAGFKPDLVWMKARSVAYNHYLYDSVRGTGTSKSLNSNTTSAEGADAANANLASFDSNGFTLGTTSGTNALNASGQTFVGWQWQAGQGSTSTNTNGTITSTVSVNASAGFSVVSYTGTAANATVGHGLGVAPRLLIGKTRSTTSNWPTYHASLGNTQGVYLNGTNAATTSVNFWNNTSPTSSVFTIGGLNEINTSGQTQVVYAWAPIAGFSQFDSFIGNGSATGPFVYCGFQPRYILIKNSSGAYSWVIFDTARNTYNSVTNYLLADLSSAEATGIPINVTANGFQIASVNAAYNAAGNVMIYAAFASNPFKNSLAF